MQPFGTKCRDDMSILEQRCMKSEAAPLSMRTDLLGSFHVTLTMTIVNHGNSVFINIVILTSVAVVF